MFWTEKKHEKTVTTKKLAFLKKLFQLLWTTCRSTLSKVVGIIEMKFLYIVSKKFVNFIDFKKSAYDGQGIYRCDLELIIL